METVRKLYDAWQTARSFALCPLISFVAGWLSHESDRGKLNGPNAAAANILLVATVVLVAILVGVGGLQWARGQLTRSAKIVACLTLVAMVVAFAAGWIIRIG